MGIAHLALDFGPRDQRRDRVDDDQVDGAGANQSVGDLQRLLAGIGLRHQEIVEVDSRLYRVRRIERVLDVYVSGGTPRLLGLSDDVLSQS